MVKQNTPLTFSFVAITFMILVLLVLLAFVIYFLVRQTIENYGEKKKIREREQRELYALQPEPIKVGAFSFPSKNVRDILMPSDLLSSQLMVPPVISRQWQGVY